MSILTTGDRKILPLIDRGVGGFHLGTEWYLGWEPMDYQYLFHHVKQPNCTWVGAIATGKTTTVAASYMMDCLTLPGFRALNTSISARQAELPFEMIMSWLDGNPKLEHLIDDIKLRPFPIIKYKNSSMYMFRTMGKEARLIRGEEYDRINIDEAGYMFDDIALKVLRGRLRGKRPDGSHRMARMDVVGSPTATDWYVKRFDRGTAGNRSADLNNYFSMRTTTYDNTHLTKQQIALMEAEYPPSMIRVELGGEFPDFGMTMFPKSHVQAITDIYLNDLANEGTRTDSGAAKRGYVLEEDPRQGIMKFELPRESGHRYVLAGDPGVDNPPRRNTAVNVVLDVTERPHKLVYFDWVQGNGSYFPFLDSYNYALKKYQPTIKGLDATGTQKALDELAFESKGIQLDKIHFGRDKAAILNDLTFAITGHAIRIPMIKGMNNQLLSYSRERERDKRFAQDIVMALGMAAHLSRYAPEEGASDHEIKGNNYRDRRQRASRKSRR
jgi:hypothetical protein